MKNLTTISLSLAAALSLIACAEKAEPTTAAETAAPATPSDPATPLAGDPASAWVELIGAWAQPGGCGDDMGKWIIEAEAFHLYEMHCPVERLELFQNGVRATSNCSVEGSDDRVEDVFSFMRQPDATLTIVNENNGARTEGLAACDDSGAEL